MWYMIHYVAPVVSDPKLKCPQLSVALIIDHKIKSRGGVPQLINT